MGQGSQSTTQVVWIAATAAGLALLPWYSVEGSWWSAPALLHGFRGKPWLLALFLPVIAALAARPWSMPRMRAGMVLMLAGGIGLVLLLAQGFLFRHPNITPAGWPTQAGMGYGALLVATGFLMLFCLGLAARGFCRGDAFVVGAIGLVVATIAAFVFFPIFVMLRSAFEGNFFASFFDRSIWGVDCLYSSLRCGVAWNTVFLAVVVGA
ncbi:MAG: hypothetical protein ACREUS_01060, partial [Burkholderiales bacterium]